jgi:hypothetical protein
VAAGWIEFPVGAAVASPPRDALNSKMTHDF